jgi:hypothetical protein
MSRLVAIQTVQTRFDDTFSEWRPADFKIAPCGNRDTGQNRGPLKALELEPSDFRSVAEPKISQLQQQPLSVT